MCAYAAHKMQQGRKRKVYISTGECHWTYPKREGNHHRGIPKLRDFQGAKLVTHLYEVNHSPPGEI